MQRRTALILIIVSLAAALAIPLAARFIPRRPQTRTITLEAHKYGYSPERIFVNKGDTIILKPTSKDVTHGFLLDGYDLEFTIKQEGIAYLKYRWEDEDGQSHVDWDKVREVEMTADRAGKFVFRCTQTCGNLHPFMTGELIVGPNTAYDIAVSLSIWLTFSILLWWASRPDREPPSEPVRRRNLLKMVPGLEKIVRSRSFHFWVLVPSLVVFYLFILSAFWGSPVGNRNIAIIFVWILWWFALKAIFVPLGARLWCMVCPLPAPAEWISRRALTAVNYMKKPFKGLHHRYFGLQKDWPRRLRNMRLQNLIFMTMISFGIILITRPLATASLFVLILGATLILAIFFRRRVFCQYLCPVGGFLGNYAMASVTELRVIDPQVCENHKDKDCLCGSPQGWGCPWNQYPGTMDRNTHCGFCMECIKSCPKDNIGVFVRPFGADPGLRSKDEMTNVLIMLAVAIAFSVTMLGPWGWIKDAANVTESRQLIPFLGYVTVLWLGALVVFPALFKWATGWGSRLAGQPAAGDALQLQAAYALIPVGIFAWIAFSLPSVLVNYNYLLVVLSDPFGFGWNLFGTADMPYSPFIPEWIPMIQGGLLLAGLFLGIRQGLRSIGEPVNTNRAKALAMLPPALFALLAVNCLLRLYMG
ncbi:MAG: 4Fe-4S binding protein [Desulfobacteraceae bacterium]